MLHVKDIENYFRNGFWKRLIFKIKKVKIFYVYYNDFYFKWIESDNALIRYYFSRFRDIFDVSDNNFYLFIKLEE
jgi:hypothetical protein